MSQIEPWKGRHGPLLIAEIGGNHEGDFDYAVRLTDLAIKSGADVVKYQLYTGATLVSPVEAPARYQHFKKFELSVEQHIALAERCADAGVAYLASVWDVKMLEWIDPYLSIYKIGSGDVTAYPLLGEFAKRGKPILLSAGLCTLEEVIDAVRYIRASNPAYSDRSMIALMQCTSMYPISDGDVNLRAMDTLREHTGLAVGYSDHTVGTLALIFAAARGADILEFHFTDSREGKTFRDHQVSLTCEEVETLCGQLRQLWEILGDGVKRPLPCEIESGHVTSFRRAVYCRRPLKAGERLAADDLVVLRPNHGVDARRYHDVIGRKVVKDTDAFAALEIEGL